MSEWKRHIIPTIYQLTGRRYPLLEAALEKMDERAQEQLYRLLRDASEQVQRAKRTFRMWPGGPTVH